MTSNLLYGLLAIMAGSWAGSNLQLRNVYFFFSPLVIVKTETHLFTFRGLRFTLGPNGSKHQALARVNELN